MSVDMCWGGESHRDQTYRVLTRRGRVFPAGT